MPKLRSKRTGKVLNIIKKAKPKLKRKKRHQMPKRGNRLV